MSTARTPAAEPSPVPAPLSPELALVDPETAALARAALAHVTLTEDRILGRPRARVAAPPPPPPIPLLRPAAEPEAVPEPGPPPRRRRSTVARALLAAALGSLAGGLLFVPGTVDLSTRHERAAHPRTIPDFVWLPRSHATGYRVEFRRGTSIVLATTTRTPRLHVSPGALAPGRYSWAVRVLDARGRAGAPVESAAVTIP
jgi:hypothetical protein